MQGTYVNEFAATVEIVAPPPPPPDSFPSPLILSNLDFFLESSNIDHHHHHHVLILLVTSRTKNRLLLQAAALQGQRRGRERESPDASSPREPFSEPEGKWVIILSDDRTVSFPRFKNRPTLVQSPNGCVGQLSEMRTG